MVDNDNVYLLVEGEWYVYNKRRAHLGEGGMGSVLLGYNTTSGEPVAIKRIHHRLNGSRNIRERVKLESRLTFAHPNLVEILGCCESRDDGAIFIVSKFIRGKTIDVYVNSSFEPGAVRNKHLVPILRQLSNAIDFIHSKGIVHLDIKPSNIMIERGSTVKLLDLGIADVESHNIKTHGYGVHGTPGYAAPEQYISEDNPELKVDRHTDIYGLGATVYSLMTEHSPAKNKGLDDSQLIDQATKAVLDKAMSSDKSERYDTASEFVDAFEKSLMTDIPKPTNLRIVVVAAVIIGILALASIILFWLLKN